MTKEELKNKCDDFVRDVFLEIHMTESDLKLASAQVYENFLFLCDSTD